MSPLLPVLGDGISANKLTTPGKVTFHDLGRFADLGPLEERSQVHLYTALV